MAAVTFARVSKSYDGGARAVDDLNLDIADGEFMILVGPSGCGKSTALRMIAGLEEITDGDLSIGERRVNDVAPGDRDVAMVFQNYALYPHMSVRENMAFALQMQKVRKPEIARRVDEAAKILGLSELLERKPKALSGGQRQRVAMGRAIVREPKVFLMDEPLSNLDAKLRVQMRSEIIRIQQRLGTTMVYVTHDQVEAMTMGDRVAVMRKGVLQQVASPQELYDRPANLFVAGFIGSPSMNMVLATLEREDDAARSHMVARFGSHSLSIDEAAIASHPGLKTRVGNQVILGIRPEHFSDATDQDSDATCLVVTVDLFEAMGAETFLHFDTDATPAGVEEIREAADTEEADVPSAASGARMTARLDGTVRTSRGEERRVAVDTAKAYFFDAVTGLPLR